MKKRILNPQLMFILGLAIGAVARLLDIYTEHLGKMFSQMAIWILIGTVISIYSSSAKKAAIHVFVFCMGMLITYYAVAVITNGVYSAMFIIGWSVFALISPIMAYFAYRSKENGMFAIIIRIGIVAAAMMSSVVLFDGPRIYDYAICLLLIYFLFFKKMQR